MGAIQKEISQRQEELRKYNPPKAKFFNLQVPDIDLRFNPKDPKLQAYEKEAQKWFKEQPNPLRRAVNDVVDVGKEYSKKLINSPNSKAGDRLDMPPLQGVP